ncbi:helix-turn-helix transcriptional regulator [Gordonia sp. TBRC 11910]|uniref:Helix-turn-helix transcriptional regulator n=1 Tax=Gordonia asplenii TaxID=2725283 RepID=A0A848L1A1_9ACTN|nr:LuxR C-terminal-related transcriptional regulator [Gordonia asplenii]NMO02855.1 helix-turn-helix transcriptional regulator [Gordonia asplenii]
MTGPSELVGRAEVLAELARLIDAATDGARVITLVGAGGAGRSSVARAVAAGYSRTVLWAQGFPWETQRPAAVLGQLLQDDSDVSCDDAVARLGDMGEAGPVLIVVDDADLGDAASMQALTSLLAHRRTLPIAVLLTAEPGDVVVDIRESVVVELPGLSASAVADLAARSGVVPRPAVIDRLTRHTGGNPRAVLAILAQTPAAAWNRPEFDLPAPDYLVTETKMLMESATPQARALTEALAVLAAGYPDSGEILSTASQLAGIDDPLAALDDALAVGLLTVTGGLRPAEATPTLGGPMKAAAVTAVMGLAATSRAHRRAAELATDPVRRLQHLVAATPVADDELANRLDALAGERGGDGAWSDAARLFRQSSRLTVNPAARDERLTRAVDALLAAGDCVAATALVPAVESLRETPLREVTLAYLAILRGRSAEADMRLERAWSICNVGREPDTAGMIAQRRVLHSLVRCQGTELVQWADTAIGMSGAESSAGIEASVIKGLGLAWSGENDAAKVLYADLTASIRHGAQAQRVTMGRGWLELGIDDVDAARSSLETAVSMAELGGSTRITLWALGWLSRVQFVTGDWNLALETVRRGRALARSSGIALATPLLEWTAAQVYSLRGDWGSASEAVANSVVGEGSYEIMAVPMCLARAARAEAGADYAKVREALSPVARLAQGAQGLNEPGFWPWVDVLANALVVEGQLDDADKLLAPHEERALARGRRSARARLGYARGRLSGALGDLPSARRSFEESLENLEGLPLRYDLARVNFTYGQTLRRAGKRRAADAVITRARDLYESLGAQTYVQRCDRELRAGGLNAPRGSRDGVELTPQEEAVSALVVQGLSNREVAAELYISPKTVQYHLTRIFGKMGVRSRSELTARLK